MPSFRPLGLFACLLASFAGQPAGAASNGINGYSGKNGVICSQCHGGGIVPTVTISGPTEVQPQSTHTYTLTIGGGQQVAGGLDVAAEAGALSVADPGTHLQGGEITHDSPRIIDVNLEVVFSFNWTAPPEAGVYTLYGAGNSVNFNGSPSGDHPAADTLQVSVTQAEPTPGEASGALLAPLLVTDFDPLTGGLALSYDAACSTTSNNIYFGPLSQVATYGYSGEVCDIGADGIHNGFDPGPGSRFFLVVGTDGPDEGSYGRDRLADGSSSERPNFAGNACGQVQTLAARCD